MVIVKRIIYLLLPTSYFLLPSSYFLPLTLPIPYKYSKKRESHSAALQIIRVHLLNIVYHYLPRGCCPSVNFRLNFGKGNFFQFSVLLSRGEKNNKKKRATWVALRIIRVHLLNIVYHFLPRGCYPL